MNSIHLDVISSSYSSSPALGTMKPPIWTMSLNPQTCVLVASGPAAAAHVSIAMYSLSCSPLFSLNEILMPFPEPHALVQLLSHQHRASNVGLWRAVCVAQLSSGSWMPPGQADFLHGWPSHLTLSLRLMFWGSVSPAPQVHQVRCMPNHQLYCEGAVHGGIFVSQRQARALQLWCC